MIRNWERTDIAQVEGKRYLWSSSLRLAAAVFPLWLVLAFGSGVFALSMHWWSPGRELEFYTLLDAAGAILWLCGWPVAAALSRNLAAATLHQRAPAAAASHMLSSGLGLLAVCAALALALTGLLGAYNPATVLHEISTQDAPRIDLRLGPVIVIALLLGGSCALLLSIAIALWVRRLGAVTGSLAWGVIGLYANLAFAGGLVPYLAREEAAWANWAIPPTLGQLTSGVLAKLADPQIRYLYMQSLFGPLFGGWLLLACLLVILNIVLATTARNHSSSNSAGTLVATWLAALAGLTYAAAQLHAYLSDPYVPAPGDWKLIFFAGLLALLSLSWVYGWPGREKRDNHKTNFVWVVISVLVLTLATAPSIRAGTASHMEVLVAAAVTLSCMGLGLLVLRLAENNRVITRSTAGLLITALVVAGTLLLQH